MGATSHGLACHHALTLGRAWPGLVVLLQFVALEGLLVLDLFLRVFISLQNLVVLLLALLQVLIHLVFQLLAKRVHFILLLLHELGLSSENLLVATLHVQLTLFFFDFVGALLDLVRLLIVLLLG